MLWRNLEFWYRIEQNVFKECFDFESSESDLLCCKPRHQLRWCNIWLEYTKIMSGWSILENRKKYVILSLELHLFFARIMKEHSLFLEAGFTPKDISFAQKAERYKNGFERLLMSAVRLSNGVISQEVLWDPDGVYWLRRKADATVYGNSHQSGYYPQGIQTDLRRGPSYHYRAYPGSKTAESNSTAVVGRPDWV